MISVLVMEQAIYKRFKLWGRRLLQALWFILLTLWGHILLSWLLLVSLLSQVACDSCQQSSALTLCDMASPQPRAQHSLTAPQFPTQIFFQCRALIFFCSLSYSICHFLHINKANLKYILSGKELKYLSSMNKINHT